MYDIDDNILERTHLRVPNVFHNFPTSSQGEGDSETRTNVTAPAGYTPRKSKPKTSWPAD